jgi:hypothetical protein
MTGLVGDTATTVPAEHGWLFRASPTWGRLNADIRAHAVGLIHLAVDRRSGSSPSIVAPSGRPADPLVEPIG